MPIPFIIAGVAAAAGIAGIGGHISAKETNEKAEAISQEAQKLYNDAKESLEQEQKKTEQVLAKLGYAKKDVLETSMKKFLNAYEKIKNIEFKNSNHLNELSKFSIDSEGAIEIRELTNIYAASFASGITGAATGTVVTLAASGALPIVTGQLTLAGSAFAAGHVGLAGGLASSALSFGAAFTPFAAIAVPALFFTGMSASKKADENLEKANTMYAEAEAASEKMKVSETLCKAVVQKSNTFYELLEYLNNKMFSECSELSAGVINKKLSTIRGRKITSEDFTQDEQKLISVTRSLAGTIKTVIDTPILSEKGTISEKCETTYQETVRYLPQYMEKVREIRTKQYDIAPEPTQRQSANYATSGKTFKEVNISGKTRNLIAVLSGFFFAFLFAGNFAEKISDETQKFLFMRAVTVNKFAIWLLICATLIVLIGRFKPPLIELLCDLSSRFALAILYVQYCRTVEQMDHYIIFSIVFFGICAAAYSFLEDKEDLWKASTFLSMQTKMLMLWSGAFLIYAFFTKWFGFSTTFWLVITSLGMFRMAFDEIL